jgi:hypothetical protein
MESSYSLGRVRIARMMRSAYTPGPPTNNATHQLWNNSTASDVLVVRGFQGVTANADWLYSQITSTKYGSPIGVVHHLIADHAPGPGLHYYADSATALPAIDYVAHSYFASTSWPYGFPVCILQPGFGLAVQASGAAHVMQLAFVWEYLDAGDAYLNEIMATS